MPSAEECKQRAAQILAAHGYGVIVVPIEHTQQKLELPDGWEVASPAEAAKPAHETPGVVTDREADALVEEWDREAADG